ncbi:MAG TPA: signal peptidase I [Verrucomicrobiales bacterium]|nr:signal peptidase I [Verrucomicrobiales bacterium]
MNLNNDNRHERLINGSDLSLRMNGAETPPPAAHGMTPSPAAAPGMVTPKRNLFWTAFADDLRQRLPVLLGLFICCVASYYLASRYMVCTVVIRGRSMTPTLRDGDQYLLNRIAYLFREPNRGELVVIRDPGHTDMAIKRIIGLPGDRIELRNGTLFVNEWPLSEPYLAPNTHTMPGHTLSHAVILGEKEYFVMGDNRSESEDSRFYGPIHRENLVGVVSL